MCVHEILILDDRQTGQKQNAFCRESQRTLIVGSKSGVTLRSRNPFSKAIALTIEAPCRKGRDPHLATFRQHFETNCTPTERCLRVSHRQIPLFSTGPTEADCGTAGSGLLSGIEVRAVRLEQSGSRYGHQAHPPGEESARARNRIQTSRQPLEVWEGDSPNRFR